MNTFKNLFLTTSLFIIEFLFSFQINAQNKPWVTAYLPTYEQQDNGDITILSEENYNMLSHISHHGPLVNTDGTFDFNANSFSEIKAEKAVTTAHQHSIPILLCIVGWFDRYYEAINDSVSRNQLIKNTLEIIDKFGYDGVDVDLEPVLSPFIPQISTQNQYYIDFISQLYDSLQLRTSSLINRPLLLTAPTTGDAGSVFAIIGSKFDQINIMTYDLVSPDWGYPVWHDSAIEYGDFFLFGKPIPSVRSEVEKFLNAGVDVAKIGIGISFDAFRWEGGYGTPSGGVTEPRQFWNASPTWDRFSNSDFMKNTFQHSFYRWDSSAKMSYLSINNEGSKNDQFWSFNDEASCKEKVDFVLNNNLGGIIIWELGLGHRSDIISGEKNPLLKAINNAANSDSSTIYYKLNVINGTGSGNYETNSEIYIIAKPAPEGKQFSQWNGDVEYVDNKNAIITKVTIQTKNINIFASYTDVNISENIKLSAYLPGNYQKENGDIDFLTSSDYDKIDEIYYSGITINPDGTLDTITNNISSIKLQSAVDKCHQYSIPIYLSVEGEIDQYYDALSDTTVGKVINKIITLISHYGFDGVDIAFDPVISPWINHIKDNNIRYENFIKALSDSIRNTDSLKLTVLTNFWSNQLFSSLQEFVDVINIRTFHMADPRGGGWIICNDSPVSNGGQIIPSTNNLVPSLPQYISNFTDLGIPRNKIGMVISSEAVRWKGLEELSGGNGAIKPYNSYKEPGEWNDWTGHWDRFSYKHFIENILGDKIIQWDEKGKNSYLSIDENGYQNDQFWSFDDSLTCALKTNYAKQNNISNILYMNIFNGYIQSKFTENHLPQLNAIYNELQKPTAIEDEYIKPESSKSKISLTNYPNPFNASTLIKYNIIKEGYVNLSIYNILGQLIETIVEYKQVPGIYEYIWPSANKGFNLPSGIYIIRLHTDENNIVSKLNLVK